MRTPTDPPARTDRRYTNSTSTHPPTNPSISPPSPTPTHAHRQKLEAYTSIMTITRTIKTRTSTRTSTTTTTTTTIVLKSAIRDFFLQSPHCAANCLQHVRSSGPGADVCKSRAALKALNTCNMSCATWYEGTAQLLNFKELKLHLL